MVNLYIDPGTGSMLFTILISAVSAVVYVVRILWIKAKTMAGVKTQAERNAKKIPVVIFADHKRYWSTFKPICEELEKRGQKAVYMTASPDDPALECHFENIKTEFIGEGNKAYAKLNMLIAGVVVATTPNLDVFQWKRSKTVDYYVHVFHASGDTALCRLYGLDYYDALMLPGEFAEHEVKELERQRNLPPKELKMMGLPYLDSMYKRASTYEMKTDGEKTVLLSPTWGPNSILVKFGAPFIDRLIETGYNIVIRPHPQSYTADKDTIETLMAKYPDSDKLHWNRDNDNFDVLASADVMISDYSGVMYDYIFIFNKPVIYTTEGYTKDPYDCWCLEGETWMVSTIRKLGKELTRENADNIKKLIDTSIAEGVDPVEVEQARIETWCNVGNSASLIADYIVDKYAGIEAEQMEKEKEANK